MQTGIYHLGSSFRTTLGRHWKKLEAQLPNQVVASMAFAPDGRLCVSSIGDGLLCLEV